MALVTDRTSSYLVPRMSFVSLERAGSNANAR
jgi:hypothetical protein